MTIWIDAQLSPALALWIAQTFGISAVALRDIGLRDEVRLLEELGPPPQIIWITCGNTSNARLKDLLQTALPRVLEFLTAGESLVELSDLHETRGEKE